MIVNREAIRDFVTSAQVAGHLPRKGKEGRVPVLAFQLEDLTLVFTDLPGSRQLRRMEFKLNEMKALVNGDRELRLTAPHPSDPTQWVDLPLTEETEAMVTAFLAWRLEALELKGR